MQAAVGHVVNILLMMTAARGLPGRAATIVAAVAIMLVAANLRPAVVAVAPLIGPIRDTTGISNAAAGLLTALPVFAFGVAAPVAPRIAHRFGIERTIFGALVVIIAAILLRLIPNSLALFGGSAAMGAGIGICNVMLPALIKRDFAHRSGLMTGLYSMTLSGGAAVAAAFVVPINDALRGDWRLTLALCAIPVIVALLVWCTQLGYVHRVTPTSGASSVWRNPIAWAITIFMGTQSLIFYTFCAWLPQYLVDRGMPPSGAGAVLAAGQVAGLLASLVAPIIAGRFRDQRLFTFAVMGICAIGFVGLLTTSSVPTLWSMCILAGPGASLSLALLFMVLRSTSTQQTGQVSGMAQCAGYILAATGPVAFGALHDVSGSWALAMTVLSFVLVPQALASLRAAKNVTMDATG